MVRNYRKEGDFMVSVTIAGKLAWEVKLSNIPCDGNDSYVLNNCISFRTSNKKFPYALIQMTAWGAKGELIAKHAKKGDKIAVTGELRNNSQKIGDRDYMFHYLLVDKVTFIEPKKISEDDLMNNSDNDDLPL